MTGLLEELPTVWTGVRLDATVAQDVRDQVVFGRVRLVTHAAFPALQTVSHVHTVRFVNLDVDVQTVYPSTAVPTQRLRRRRLLMLTSSTTICPHHAVAAVLILTPMPISPES